MREVSERTRTRVAIVSPIVARYDAISTSARDTWRSFAGDPNFETALLTLRNDFPELPARVVSGVADLLLQAEFNDADLIIYNFGIHNELLDALLVSKGRRGQIVRFHNITPPDLAPASQRDVIEKSFRQIHLLNDADEIWADSEVNAGVLREHGIDAARIRVIPLMVEDPAPARMRDKGTKLIEVLFLGRFVQSKGVLDLIEAAEAARHLTQVPFHLRLAGNTEWSDAKYLRRVKETIAAYSLGEIVEFCGTVDDQEREALLHAAHILAIPSYHEGFCKPVIEALRSGTIPVGYAAANLPTIVNGFGRLVPSGDGKALGAALVEVIEGLSRAMGEPSSPCLPLDRGPTSVDDFEAATRKYVSEFLPEEVGPMIRREALKVVGVNGATRISGSAKGELTVAPVQSGSGPTSGESYCGYSQADLWLFDLFAGIQPQPSPGFVTDFLGTRTRISSLWDAVRTFDGHVFGIPVPYDLFEAIEWIGLLKAVASAESGRFAMMELGAGLGPWLVAGSKAAKLRGIHDIRLLGVEADPGRFALMQQHFLDNDLDPAAHHLICAAVGAEAGRARWPKITDPPNAAGARPVAERCGKLDPEDVSYMSGAVDGDFVEVEIVPFARLLAKEPVWDLVHFDVQGWEAKLCRCCVTQLSNSTRWIVVGTHSRHIEGEIIETLHAAGWVLENEKPTRFRFDPLKTSITLMTDVDGVQVWRNARLVDSPAPHRKELSRGNAIESPAGIGHPRPTFPSLTPLNIDQRARVFATRNDLISALEIPGGASIVEVGVALGDFSESMIEIVHPSRFVAIDFFKLHEIPELWGRSTREIFGQLSHLDYYRDRFAKYGQRISIEVGPSHEMLAKYPDETFDLIYIDAGHDYHDVSRDAAVAAHKLKKDGVIVFNDYTMFDLNGAPYGVVPAVNELVATGSWRVVGFALQAHMFCDIAIRRSTRS